MSVNRKDRSHTGARAQGKVAVWGGAVENKKRLEDLEEQLIPVVNRYMAAHPRDPHETDEQCRERQAKNLSIFNAAWILAVEERMGSPLPEEWWNQIKPEDNERMMEILRDCLDVLSNAS